MQNALLPAERPRRPMLDLAVAVGLFGAVALLQFHGGAYRSEFGNHSDEPAHVVTGLMVRDYLASRDWTSPRAFAEDYYAHYPKVALGHWPPTFYLLQAIWMLLFGATRNALLLLMACLSAALGFLVYTVARGQFRQSLAIASAFVFVTLPFVQEQSSSVMSEPPVSLIAFAAALAYTKYLETDRPTVWAVVFAMLASAGILTKASALFLAAVPLWSIVLIRRFRCLRRPGFWLPAAIVAILCAPYYVITVHMQRYGQAGVSIHYSLSAIHFYARGLVAAAGVFLTLLALTGMTSYVLVPLWRKRGVEPVWAMHASMIVSVLGFHVFVPSGLDDRYLLELLGSTVLFAAAGFDWLFRRVSQLRYGGARYMFLVLAALAAATEFKFYRKEWHGFSELVSSIAADTDWDRAVLLIASDPKGEGMFIAEVALADRRPNRYALRASKLLASDDWMGRGYREKFATTLELAQFLRTVPVGILILDFSADPAWTPEHNRRLVAMVHEFPEEWHLIGQYDVVRDGQHYPNALQLYESQSMWSDPAP